MANEIAILDSDGAGLLTALFLYPIATPKTFTNGSGAQQTVIYTPSASLPSRGADVLSAAEKAELDNGTLAFEVVHFRYDPAIGDAGNTTNIKAAYADHKATATTRYQDTFRYTGVRISYP